MFDHTDLRVDGRDRGRASYLLPPPMPFESRSPRWSSIERLRSPPQDLVVQLKSEPVVLGNIAQRADVYFQLGPDKLERRPGERMSHRFVDRHIIEESQRNIPYCSYESRHVRIGEDRLQRLRKVIRLPHYDDDHASVGAVNRLLRWTGGTAVLIVRTTQPQAAQKKDDVQYSQSITSNTCAQHRHQLRPRSPLRRAGAPTRRMPRRPRDGSGSQLNAPLDTVWPRPCLLLAQESSIQET